MKRTLISFFLGIVVGALLWQWKPIAVKPSPFFPRTLEKSLSEDKINKILQSTENTLRENPNDLEAMVNRGIVYFYQGPEKYADSLNAFNSAWTRGALDVRIFYYTGILYENLSLFDQAEQQYERFLHHFPKDREIRLRLARLLARMNKWDECAQAYQEFLQEDPNDTTALVNCGLAYSNKIESIKSVQKKLTPDQQEALSSDAHNGIGALENAIKIENKLPENIYLTLAKLYIEVGDFSKAISACENEIKNYPNSVEAWKTAAWLYNKVNDKTALKNARAKISELQPKKSTSQESSAKNKSTQRPTKKSKKK